MDWFALSMFVIYGVSLVFWILILINALLGNVQNKFWQTICNRVGTIFGHCAGETLNDGLFMAFILINLFATVFIVWAAWRILF